MPWWWPPGSGHTGGRSESKQANELLSWVSCRLRRIAARKLTPGRPWANAGERVTAPADPIMCRPPLTRLSTRRLAHPTARAVMLSGADYHKGGRLFARGGTEPGVGPQRGWFTSLLRPTTIRANN